MAFSTIVVNLPNVVVVCYNVQYYIAPMKQQYDINTREQLWEYYGGREAVARRFGITLGAVGQYTSRGIAQGYISRIILDLVLDSKTWNPEIFELKEHPGAWRLNELIARHKLGQEAFA